MTGHDRGPDRPKSKTQSRPHSRPEIEYEYRFAEYEYEYDKVKAAFVVKPVRAVHRRQNTRSAMWQRQISVQSGLHADQDAQRSRAALSIAP